MPGGYHLLYAFQIIQQITVILPQHRSEFTEIYTLPEEIPHEQDHGSPVLIADIDLHTGQVPHQCITEHLLHVYIRIDVCRQDLLHPGFQLFQVCIFIDGQIGILIKRKFCFQRLVIRIFFIFLNIHVFDIGIILPIIDKPPEIRRGIQIELLAVRQRSHILFLGFQIGPDISLYQDQGGYTDHDQKDK